MHRKNIHERSGIVGEWMEWEMSGLRDLGVNSLSYNILVFNQS